MSEANGARKSKPVARADWRESPVRHWSADDFQEPSDPALRFVTRLGAFAAVCIALAAIAWLARGCFGA